MASNDEMGVVQTANKKSGKIESVRIEVADGGFVVECNYRSKPSKEPQPYMPPTKKVFESRAGLLSFLEEKLSEKPGGNSGESYDED